MEDLLVPRPEGVYCPAGGFHIDPWRPVERAVLTHAHSDHARAGSKAYLCAEPGRAIASERVGRDARMETLPYERELETGGVRVSFHPAGHVLGFAQIRMERAGCVWVASGDYKLDPDSTCEPFESVPCDVFLTESTFALPVYRWDVPGEIARMNRWWSANRAEGRTSVVYASSVGKAQRVLAPVDPSIGPILVHGAVAR